MEETKPKLQVVFDVDMLNLFIDIKDMQIKYSLRRVHGAMLLKALLQEQESILYDCLCETSTSQNIYRNVIADCEAFLKGIASEEKNIEDDEKPFKLVTSNQSVFLDFYFELDAKNVLQTAYTILEEEFNEDYENGELDEAESNERTLTTQVLFEAFILNIPQDALNILKDNGVNIQGIREYYSMMNEFYSTLEKNEEVTDDGKNRNSLPKSISDFVTNLTAKYINAEECEILGRDKECQKVMRILQKRGRKNVVLIGDPGVGKTSIVERIAFDIAKGNCPECLKNHRVIQLNVNSAIAGTRYRGDAEERFQKLVDFLEQNDDVILFVDEIHMVVGAGATSNNDELDMANALKPFLASKKAKVIGATTTVEYERSFTKDAAFKRRFEKIKVKEPKSKEVYPMLKNVIKEHEKYHGVKISEEMVQYAVLISSCFNNNTKNPDRTNDLIDSAMVIAKESGKEYVDKESILENFDINFEKFNNMDDSKKITVAYHEAGHYIAWRKSGRLIDWKGIAISIMPAEEYLGVTVFDELDDEVTVETNREYYIDYIALQLAGRVAEKVYTNTISSGASADLDKANKLAYGIICKYGMSKNALNRIYIEDEEYHMMSEAIVNRVDEEVKEIIEEATQRAKQIICQNTNLLDKLVKELMEKSILDENDLERICKSVDSV